MLFWRSDGTRLRGRDERICDGFYAAQSLEILRADLEDPERFALPPPPPGTRAQNALRSTL